MNKFYLSFFGACVLMVTMNHVSIAATAITINYGVVESAVTTTEKSSHAGGALAGGLMGALIGPNRHRGLKVVAGAGIGAAIQGSATGGTVEQYSVKLNSGGLRYFDLRLKAEDGEFSGEFDYGYWGPTLFLVGKF